MSPQPKKQPPVKTKTFWIGRDSGYGDYSGDPSEIQINTGANPPKVEGGRISRLHNVIELCERDFVRVTGVNLKEGEVAQVRLHVLKRVTPVSGTTTTEHEEPK